MSVDISVSITEDVVDIIATPTVNIVNVTNSASIDPGLYDLSEFTNTSPNPFVRASGLSSYVPTSRTITINGLTQDLSINRSWTIPATTWGTITGTLSAQTDLQSALDAKVPTSRTLTINGVTQDLSANRTFTISTGITIGSTAIASGVVGRVLFEGAGNVVQESSSLTYDDTLKTFTLIGPISSVIQHTALTNYNGLGGFQLNVADGTERGIFKLNPTSGEIRIGATGSGYFPTFYAQGVEAMRIFASTRNVGIGTTTDAGFRLDVNGTARVKTDLKIDTATGGLIIEGDASGYPTLKINTLRSGTTRRNWMFATEQINGGDFILFRSATAGGVANTLVYSIFNDGNFGLNTSTNAGFRLDVNGTARVQSTLNIGTGSAVIASDNNNNGRFVFSRGTTNDISMRVITQGSGAVVIQGTQFLNTSATEAIIFQQNGGGFGIGTSAVPTELFEIERVYSGGVTANNSSLLIKSTISKSGGTNTFALSNISPVINCTGGTSIVRGIYYNPTLTNTTGVTHYAIHTVNGLVRFENLPTSSAGLPAGTLYNNLGVLMIA